MSPSLRSVLKREVLSVNHNDQDVGEENWGEDVSFVWRPWLWQTCTEFGWYQTTNQAEQLYGSSLPLEFFEQWCRDAFGEEFTHDMLQRSLL